MRIVETQHPRSVWIMEGEGIGNAVRHLVGLRNQPDLELQEMPTGEKVAPTVVIKQPLQGVLMRFY